MRASFLLYAIGYLMMIAGIGYGLFLVGVPQVWIGVAATVLLGAGLIYSVSRSEQDSAMHKSASNRQPQ